MTDLNLLRAALLATALTLSACAVSSPSTAAAPPQGLTAQDLVGTWDVALYFSADSPPSSTVMEIAAANADGTLEGSFYATPFELGRYTVRDGVVILSAITADGSGPYATSGRVVRAGQIDGQTLSAGRDFLMAWTATKR